MDQTVNLGGIVSGPVQVAETADLLMAQNFPTMSGNHERQLLAQLALPMARWHTRTRDGYAATQLTPAAIDWLAALPATPALNDEVWLCHGHGTPDNDLHYWLETVVPGFERGAGPGVPAAAADEVRGRLGAPPCTWCCCAVTPMCCASPNAKALTARC